MALARANARLSSSPFSSGVIPYLQVTLERTAQALTWLFLALISIVAAAHLSEGRRDTPVKRTAYVRALIRLQQF